MKNVFVIGAHGHVGRLAVPELAKAGYHVLAGVRKRDQFDELASLNNVSPVLFDLNATPDEIADVFKSQKAEAIVFSAGSGGSTGDDQTLAIDLDGAIKTMQAAEQAGIKRYVMVSAAGADDRNVWPVSGIPGYFVAKHYADAFLKASALDYTILRPATLTNGSATGKITMNPSSFKDASIARADVSRTIVAALNSKNADKKVFQFTSGNDDINKVI